MMRRRTLCCSKWTECRSQQLNQSTLQQPHTTLHHIASRCITTLQTSLVNQSTNPNDCSANSNSIHCYTHYQLSLSASSFLYSTPLCPFPIYLFILSSPPLPPLFYPLFYFHLPNLHSLPFSPANLHNSFTLPFLLPSLCPMPYALYRPACMLLPLDDAYVLGSLSWRTAPRRCSH